MDQSLPNPNCPQCQNFHINRNFCNMLETWLKRSEIGLRQVGHSDAFGFCLFVCYVFVFFLFLQTQAAKF